eukprot:TRINITY_DN695_c0_g1_i1.p1 TRINITY_DN695_c0_g1~~TRINITY_DN695_c0_g1_i1.p1  ORF type:complete len:157 (-),score=15.86 TRINITY_DN695_c0_g1_i1:418-888(-)
MARKCCGHCSGSAVSRLDKSRKFYERMPRKPAECFAFDHIKQIRQNSVDVFSVDCGDKPCTLTADENAVLSSDNSRNVQSIFVNSNVEGGQAICMQQALDFFQTSVDPSKYDTIIMIRHDVEWLDSIFSWSGANFKGFNFFSRCEGWWFCGPQRWT